MLKILLTILLVSGSGYFTLSQETTFKLLTTLKVKAEFFTTDPLGNCYVIAGNTLSKYDNNGRFLNDFSKREYGEFRFVDASDPMKVLVYYPDFGLIDFLDNNLSENSFLDLNKYGIIQPTALCRSINNGIWLYDHQKLQLLLINSELGITTESNFFNQLFSDQYIPGIMVESEEWLVICDQERGFRIFDRLAAFYKQIDIDGIKNLQIKRNDLIFLDEGKLQSINIQTGLKSIIATPDIGDAIDARIERDRIFLHYANRIDIYQLRR